MATKRMCPQTVMLYNYVGEVDDRASYAVTYLHNVKCVSYRGINPTTQGRGEADTAKLYIFDDILYAADTEGNEVQYMVYENWKKLDKKTGYWTLNPDGYDFFYEGDTLPHTGPKFKVNGFKRLDQGSRRLVHFEVDGG